MNKHNFRLTRGATVIPIALVLVSILLFSCGDPRAKDQTPVEDTIREYRQPLENANRRLVIREAAQIDDYITRYGWTMETTGTGLRYHIYHKGNGLAPQKDMNATIRFRVNLLNGTVVYDSRTDGLKSFRLGKAEVESGLEEGLMLMQVGDKARMIIPSHLAFGLLGDDNKIPKRATLVYDVELIAVN